MQNLPAFSLRKILLLSTLVFRGDYHLAAKLFVEGVKAAGAEPDRDAIVDGLLGLGTIDIGLEEPLSLGRNDHQASDAVWPTIITNGRFESVEWASLLP